MSRNLRKVPLDIILQSYLWAAVQKQKVETWKSQRKSWKTGKIWQEQRMDKNYGHMNNTYFVLKDAGITWSDSVHCLQAIPGCLVIWLDILLCWVYLAKFSQDGMRSAVSLQWWFLWEYTWVCHLVRQSQLHLSPKGTYHWTKVSQSAMLVVPLWQYI